MQGDRRSVSCFRPANSLRSANRLGCQSARYCGSAQETIRIKLNIQPDEHWQRSVELMGRRTGEIKETSGRGKICGSLRSKPQTISCTASAADVQAHRDLGHVRKRNSSNILFRRVVKPTISFRLLVYSSATENATGSPCRTAALFVSGHQELAGHQRGPDST